MTDAHLRQSAPPEERTAVVTGASSGVGRAIAIALARQGFKLCVVGRNADRLAQTVAAAQAFAPVKAFMMDLAHETNLQPLAEALEKDAERLDVLVHAAGTIRQGTLGAASIEHLDEQYGINVRAPYALTQRLLPFLIKGRGQIVVINSSTGLAVNRPEIAQYAATKHALRAIADSVRAEVNQKGIRVLSVYLGRTATPMQEALYRREARPYDPEKLLQPEDVATMVLAALALPPTAEVTDISMRPMIKNVD